MTPNAFRELARSLLDVAVTNYLGAEEVRFRNVVIGAIGFPDPGIVTLRVSLDDQAASIAKDGAAFSKEAGGPGARGGIRVRLVLADAADISSALEAACRHGSKRSKTGVQPRWVAS